MNKKLLIPLVFLLTISSVSAEAVKHLLNTSSGLESWAFCPSAGYDCINNDYTCGKPEDDPRAITKNRDCLQGNGLAKMYVMFNLSEINAPTHHSIVNATIHLNYRGQGGTGNKQAVFYHIYNDTWRGFYHRNRRTNATWDMSRNDTPFYNGTDIWNGAKPTDAVRQEWANVETDGLFSFGVGNATSSGDTWAVWTTVKEEGSHYLPRMTIYTECVPNWTILSNVTTCFNTTRKMTNETYIDDYNCSESYEILTYEDVPDERVYECQSGSFVYTGSCGDSICYSGVGEDQDNCCTDCGCPEFYRCKDNSCTEKQTERLLAGAGEGTGTFLDQVRTPLVALLLNLGIISFVLFVVYGVATAVDKLIMGGGGNE